MKYWKQIEEEEERNPKPKPQILDENIHPAHEVWLDWYRVKFHEGFLRGHMIRVIDHKYASDQKVYDRIAEIIRFDGDKVSSEYLVKTKRHLEKYALEEYGRKLSL